MAVNFTSKPPATISRPRARRRSLFRGLLAMGGQASESVSTPPPGGKRDDTNRKAWSGWTTQNDCHLGQSERCDALRDLGLIRIAGNGHRLAVSPLFSQPSTSPCLVPAAPCSRHTSVPHASDRRSRRDGGCCRSGRASSSRLVRPPFARPLRGVHHPTDLGVLV
jgi:hypothetical protein